MGNGSLEVISGLWFFRAISILLPVFTYGTHLGSASLTHVPYKPIHINNHQDPRRGEILCLIQAPATYKTVRNIVIKEAATAKEIEIPVVYTTATKQVAKVSAGNVKHTPLEAEFRAPAGKACMQVLDLIAGCKLIYGE